jgi:hypothetical protein
MYFVGIQNFVSDIEIPNLEEHCIINQSIILEIARYEIEFLHLFLGVCLTDELLNEMELDNGKWIFKEDTPQKYKDLVFGVKYENSNSNYYNSCNCGCNSTICKELKWEGLITKGKYLDASGVEVEYKQRNLIAYYIYTKYREIYKTSTQQIGESNLNSKIFSPSIIGWFDKYYNAQRLLFENIKGCRNNGLVSLYDFLKDHKEDFPNHQGICLTEPNTWGLV